MIYIISIFAASILALAIVWKTFLTPLFALQKKLSISIRDEVYPTILEINKTIITIASASIVLTVQLLRDPIIISKEYLVFSWICFCGAIFVGVLILLAYYVQRYVDKITFNEFNKGIEEKNHEKKRGIMQAVLPLLRKQRQLARIMFVSLYSETTLLLLALVSLVVFGINNLSR